ncbi:hypothetical protein ASPZODRAFT_65782 [Penicilliopsis zonata CBS 506.65]|uniref:Major facilitator superfamily (MFS) profile domain-containing protein n=1 Tax=Penicilliopsis zonata CBS 506.65 TaxID=1073090 RepID=A0A1L9SI47_9EURO|nr:hypothetical protein ASPZODRAFT_65782 [Penicilliopsis zonata CBS 506.65]OJJ46858.1 hypothetical protein ASPZODRAFT_65782 [Penicilliopsis zonata CBS 506.65]
MASSSPSSTHPTDTLQLEDPNDNNINLDAENADSTVYPAGLQLWMSLVSCVFSMLLVGLDLTIVAVCVPSLTNEFHTVQDLGWYSAAYMLISSSFILFCSRLYAVFPVKRLFLISTAIFELGSLVCTVAPLSIVFILGRAIAGLGSCSLQVGVLLILTHSFPKAKRPMWTSICFAIQTLAMVLAPLVGGVLIDAWSWRLCFAINLPLGVVTFLLTFFAFHDPVVNPDVTLSIADKLKRLDLLGTLFFVPSIVCLLIAMQWGGIKYGWGSPVVISLLVIFALFLTLFAVIQYRQNDHATLPARILRQRSVLAGAWFGTCYNGILAVTEYYISIYFQGIRGYSAAKSGALGVPLMVGMMAASFASGVFTTTIGYYYPLMFATSILAPIASGLLTTLPVEENLAKILAYLGFLGVAVGLGMQSPVVAVQTVLPMKDVATGISITGLAGGMGSALFISASATLFQTRLQAEVAQYAPGTNVTAFVDGGLDHVREYIGGNRLQSVLLGYDKAVMQTLYMPVALGGLTLLGSLAMERKSVKKKAA